MFLCFRDLGKNFRSVSFQTFLNTKVIQIWRQFDSQLKIVVSGERIIYQNALKYNTGT